MNRTDGDKEKLLYFFREISKIPRGSGNEEQIGKYLEDFAQKRGLWCYRDELHNVVIKKGGSKGAEDLPPVMLQGHTDMVCEKRREVEHDFTRGRRPSESGRNNFGSGQRGGDSRYAGSAG